MISRISTVPVTHEIKEQKAFYFYPDQKYFIQGDALEKPLNNPDLIFKITFSGQVDRFIYLLEKEAEKFVNLSTYINQLTTKDLRDFYNTSFKNYLKS
jgi:hypothetical protein